MDPCSFFFLFLVKKVKSCGGFLRYLKAKHVDIETGRLGFHGRNIVLYWKGRRHDEKNKDQDLMCLPCSSKQ